MAEPGAQTETGAPGGDPGDGFGLSAEFVREVVEAAHSGERELVQSLAATLHAADFADLIDQITADDRAALFDCIGDKFDPEIFTELSDEVRAEIVDRLKPVEIASLVRELETDDAVYLLEDLDEAEQQEVLAAVPAAERAAVEQALRYPEESAGRLMQRDFIAVPDFWTIGQIIDFLRDSDDLPDDFYEIFVVDPSFRPLGEVALNRAMRAKRPVVVRDIMDPDLDLIPAEMDQEEVARIFQQYDLTSAPVVDDRGRLIGVIMVDDVLDVIQEENEEDLMLLSGVSQTDINASVGRTVRQRASWLSVSLVSALVASVVVGFFEATIEEVVALAILLPVVSAMGGNAGTQALTVAVRALATRELTETNAARLVGKEMMVGFLNGVLFAVVVGVVAGVWFGRPLLGVVIAVALVANLVVAGFLGIVIPLGLTRIKVDPALAAGVFLTMITDVFGFVAFLGLGAWLLL